MFLAINLISISIKIPLKNLSNSTELITGALMPIELFRGGKFCNFDTSAVKLKNTNFIPIIPNNCLEKQIKLFKTLKVPGIIIVNEVRNFDTDLPVFSMNQRDYDFLMNLIHNNMENYRGIRNVNDIVNAILTGMLSKVVIGLEADMENLSILTSLIIQIPPIITILLIIILLRNFLGNDESRVNYRYEDVKVDEYRLRRESFCSVCSICYEEFDRYDTLRVLECEHCFHIDCIGTWLTHSNVCPMCRKDVYSGSLVSFGDIIYI